MPAAAGNDYGWMNETWRAPLSSRNSSVPLLMDHTVALSSAARYCCSTLSLGSPQAIMVCIRGPMSMVVSV